MKCNKHSVVVIAPSRHSRTSAEKAKLRTFELSPWMFACIVLVSFFDTCTYLYWVRQRGTKRHVSIHLYSWRNKAEHERKVFGLFLPSWSKLFCFRARIVRQTLSDRMSSITSLAANNADSGDSKLVRAFGSESW